MPFILTSLQAGYRQTCPLFRPWMLRPLVTVSAISETRRNRIDVFEALINTLRVLLLCLAKKTQ